MIRNRAECVLSKTWLCGDILCFNWREMLATSSIEDICESNQNSQTGSCLNNFGASLLVKNLKFGDDGNLV